MAPRGRRIRTPSGTSLPRASTGRLVSRNLDRAAVAALSSAEISRMSRLELVKVVQTGRLPAVSARPEYLDRRTLERLAYVARLCCRNRACHLSPGPDQGRGAQYDCERPLN